MVDPGLRVVCSNLPPVSLGYLSEFLSKGAVEHQVLDMKLGYGVSDLLGKINSFSADLVVFHTGVFLTDSVGAQGLFRLVEAVKKSSKAKVLLGGPPVILLGSKLLKLCPADYAIRGDLESPLLDLCSGADLGGINGLIYRLESSVIDGGGCSVTDFSEVSYPKYGRFEVSRYEPGAISIITSRGCANQCTFCFHPLMAGSTYRSRSIDDVSAELRYWSSRGYVKFIVTDDNFGYDRGRLMSICRMILDGGFPGIEIHVLNIRVDCLDEKTISLMSKAGFKSLGFGVESGSDKVLARLRKGISSKDIDAALASALRVGFSVTLYVMVGSPGEGWAEVLDTLRLILRHNVTVRVSSITAVPGTELFDWVQERKFFLMEPEEYFLLTRGMLSVTPMFRTDEMGAFQKRLALLLAASVGWLVSSRLRFRGMASHWVLGAYGFIGRMPMSAPLFTAVEIAYRLAGKLLGKTSMPAYDGGWRLRLQPYPRNGALISRCDVGAVGSALRSGRLTMFGGTRVREFEERFAEYVGSKYAVAVSSGTAALHCSLLAAGVGPGDEVIVPAFTYVSTAMAVLYVGAVPRFVDVGYYDANLDASLVEGAFTENTRAILPVHFCGVPCDMKRLRDLSSERGVFLIEDAAQAVGSLYGGRKVGSIGDMGCFSFHETKNLTCGEGGMVVTDDAALANRLRLARHLGESYGDGSSTSGVVDYTKPIRYDVVGFNYRLSEMQAALGLSQLGRMDEFARARRRNAACATKALAGMEFINLPKLHVGADPCYNVLPLTIAEGSPLSRDEVAIKLHCEGVPFILPYQTILPQNRVFNVGGDFPNARRFYGYGLGLYVDPVFTVGGMMDVTSTIRRLFEYSKKI